jgi:hypothetical protein
MPERWIAGWIFSWFRRTTPRAAVVALFEREQAEILRLARACTAEHRARRVLIRRLPGLEDSSRDWSVLMTLEHLRIVNAAVAETLRALAAGKVPPRVASTAAVKPSPEVDDAVIDAFAAGGAALLECAAAIPDLRTSARYAHPWFGPLDGAGWHAMAAFHLRLHRKQVAAILDGIGR